MSFMKNYKIALISAIVLIIITVSVIAYLNFLNVQQQNLDPYQFKGDTLYYSSNRNIPSFNISLNYTDSNLSYDIYSIDFSSKNFLQYPTRIYGLLFLPKVNKNVPGVVLLPGGGGSKEGESKLAGIIADQGYAVLTIDQRGIGQTGGYYLSIDQDYNIFSQGNEPIQHLSVYDALRTYDVLKQISNVDKNNIAIAGESMGARYAIIAAAIDKRLKGVIAISASGFHINESESQPYIPYLVSIDPDHYIGKISPNYVFMLQGTNDSVVPFKDAEYTFSLANEPKKFSIAEDCNHGYCDKMLEYLKSDLKTIFGK